MCEKQLNKKIYENATLNQTKEEQSAFVPNTFLQEQQQQTNINEQIIKTDAAKSISKVKTAPKQTAKKSTGIWKSVKRKWGFKEKEEIEEELAKKRRGEMALSKSEIKNKINDFKKLSDEQGDYSEEKMNALKSEYSTWNDGLNDAEQNAISSYKQQDCNSMGAINSVGYSTMNSLLRSGKFKIDGAPESDKNSADVIKELEEKNLLDNADHSNEIIKELSKTKDAHEIVANTVKSIEKSTLKKDRALYRYAGLDALGVILGEKWGTSQEEIDKKMSSINKGTRIVQDNAFLSTTMFRDSASEFKGKSAIEIRILAHKGTQGVYIPAFKSKKESTLDIGTKAELDVMSKKEQELLLQAGTQMRVLKVEKKDFFNHSDMSNAKRLNMTEKAYNRWRFDLQDVMEDKLKNHTISEIELKNAGVSQLDSFAVKVDKLINQYVLDNSDIGKKQGYVIYMETIDTKPLATRESIPNN